MKNTSWIKYFLFLVIISIPLFISLTVLPVQMWDEARTGVNAYEMYKNGNWIVTHFNGEPDMWHTKPPLLVWCIAGLMKIFGASILALRLPSALFGLLTCVAILGFSVRYLKDFWVGFISCIILITSNGYVHLHGTRTGDMDSMLTFFTTAYSLCFFIFLENKNRRYLFLTFVFITLGCYTKGIAGLFFIPALAIYAIIQNQVITVLKNKYFYYGLVFFLTLVPGYYFLREHFNQGFLQAIWSNELGGRFASVNEAHEGSNWFYYRNLVTTRFSFWYLLVPCGILVGLINQNILIKRITIFSIVVSLSFLLIISFAKTKLEWYDLPAYPFLSIIAGVFVFHIYSAINSSTALLKGLKHNVISFAFLFLLFVSPYSALIRETYHPVETWQDETYTQIVYFLKDALNDKHEIDGFRIVTAGSVFHHVLFYCYMLNDKGKNVSMANIEKLKDNEKVIAYQLKTNDFINQTYNTEVIKSHYDIVLYRILNRK